MNKELRKKLTQEYKKKELEKDLSSDNSTIANFAKRSLGLTSKPLTESDILNAPDELLIELIYNKIEEVAERAYREKPLEFKCRDSFLNNLSSYLQLIYYTQQFEMLLEIGDCDKYFENTPLEEIEIAAKSYKLIGFQHLSLQIMVVARGNTEANKAEKEFDKVKNNIQRSKIDFIRENASHFQLE